MMIIKIIIETDLKSIDWNDSWMSVIFTDTGQNNVLQKLHLIDFGVPFPT